MIELIAMLADLPQMLNEENIKFLSVWVDRDQRRCSLKWKLLLHLTCGVQPNSYNCSVALRLLLQFGANPDAADEDGNRPHHVLARYNPTDEASARLPLDAGAFMGRLKNGGNTAADVWMESHRLDDPYQLPSWLRDCDPVPKLKIECTRAVCSHKVNYLKLS